MSPPSSPPSLPPEPPLPPQPPLPPPSPLSPEAARRVFLTLSLTRWLPVGLIVGLMTLLPLERGLSVPETLAAASLTGWVVFALELPTSGFADAFGRRPVYIAAALMQIAGALAFLVADSVWEFAAAAALFGIFRALDSGPLEAWFVDAVHASDPDAPIDRPLAAAATIIGAGIAAGALLSGGLVWWHPVAHWSALALPFAVFLALTVVHAAAVVALLVEPHPPGGPVPDREPRAGRALRSAAAAPGIIRDGFGMMRGNGVLRGLMFAEVFWSVGMVVFESFQPIRLGELLGSEALAGVWMGPVASAGWGVFALGSALAGLLSGRIGASRTAVLTRAGNALGAVVMGLVAGPAALVAAYLITYGLHGGTGPVHATLLHRQARSTNRATVLSMNSMLSFAAYSLASPGLGLIAAARSTQAAMVAGGVISLIGALGYVPALRRDRGLREPPEPAE